MTNIGQVLKNLRLAKNLTQEHLADKLKIPVSNYSRIENDQVKVDFNRLIAIGDVLGVNPWKILADATPRSQYSNFFAPEIEELEKNIENQKVIISELQRTLADKEQMIKDKDFIIELLKKEKL